MGVVKPVVGVVKSVAGVVKPVVGVVKSVAGVVRIATKTLEFVFLQVDEKQANQTSYQ